MRFDLIVFDLDGTLVDSIVDIAAALNRCLGARGYRQLPVAIVKTLVGAGLHSLVRRAIESQPRAMPATPGAAIGARAAPDTEIDAITAAIWDDYLARPCADSRSFADIPTVLSTLTARGVQLAVLTNKPGNVSRPLLAALDLGRYFRDVIGDGDGFARKPDPAGALELMRRAGSTAARTLVVGDGLPDVQVARAAGCKVAAAMWGYTPRDRLAAEAPEFTLDRPGDLLAALAD